MNDLPDGWGWTTLGDIAEVVGGVTKDSKKQADSSLSEVPYLRVANVQRGYLDLKEVTSIRVPEATLQKLRLLPGDILFNEGGDRDKLGRGWVWEGQVSDCIHQNHVFRARICPDEYDPKFISMYGNSVARKWFEDHGKQTVNLASISLSTLKALPVPQIPLYEQQKIVAAIEEQFSRLDAGSRVLDRLRHNLKLMRATVLDEPFAELSSSEWEPLASIGSIVTGSTPPTADSRNYGGDLPFITPSDFDHCGRMISAKRSLSDIGARSARTVLPSGSVLATCIGATLGKVALAEVPCAINQQINAVIPSGRILSEYLFYCLARPSFTRLMWSESSSTTLPILNKFRFSGLRIPVPSTRKQEQIIEKISDRLSYTDRLSIDFNRLEAKVSRLRSSILAAAFSGRLVT